MQLATTFYVQNARERELERCNSVMEVQQVQVRRKNVVMLKLTKATFYKVKLTERRIEIEK